MNERIKDILEKVKNPKIIMIIGFIGIALIALSSFLPKGEKRDKNTAAETKISIDSYKAELESDIKEIVSGITGGSSSVMITLESGIRYDYADDTKDTESNVSNAQSSTNSTSNQKSYITIKSSDGGEKALIISERMPEVRGVAIICSGILSEQTSEKINNAVCAALNITSKRVYIAGGIQDEKG